MAKAKEIKDLRPEHIPGGENMTEESLVTLNELIKKSAGVGGKYLGCVFGGIVVGLILRMMGGAVGNLLAVVAIFAGLIGGMVISTSAAKPIKAEYTRLGISDTDYKQAIKNCNSGTKAW